jgi:hypothetical protein
MGKLSYVRKKKKRFAIAAQPELRGDATVNFDAQPELRGDATVNFAAQPELCGDAYIDMLPSCRVHRKSQTLSLKKNGAL